MLKRIDQSDDIPGFAILVHSRLDPALIKKIQDAMFRFADTETGKKYFTESGLKGFKPASDEDFKLLDEFLDRKKAKKATR